MSATDEQSAETKTCRTCGHWHCPLRAKGEGIGQCRKGPPIASFTWARTREDDGCGEWKPNFDAGTAAPSQPAAVDAGSDPEHGAAGKAEVGATTGPAFARGNGRSGPRRK